MPIRIWLAVAALALAATASPMGAEGAASAPGNGLIAFVSTATADPFTDPAAGIGVASADGTGRRLLTQDVPGVAEPSWSPDGSRIALIDGSSIAIVDADGSGLETIPRPPDAVDRSPAWSPSGRLAFMRTESGGAHPALMLADGDGGRQRTLLPVAPLHGSPVWSRNGSKVELLSTSRRGMSLASVVNIAAATYVLRRLPPQCLDVPIPGPRGNAALCLGSSTHVLWLLGARSARLIVKNGAPMGQPAWSRDGTRFAYAVGNSQVVVRTLGSRRSVVAARSLNPPPRATRTPLR